MDLLFIQTLDFSVPIADGMRFLHCTKTLADAFREACALVGIELVDYHSVIFTPAGARMLVAGRSKAWCEKMQR